MVRHDPARVRPVRPARPAVPARGDGHAGDVDAVGRRYLIRFEEDTLRHRPLWLRIIVEFLGTFILVTVAAGSGVIDHYVGGDPVSRSAAVVAPGLVVMAMIYALGPLSGLHINPAVTLAFAGRRVFKAGWVAPYLVAQLVGAVCAAWFLQGMYGHVSAGGNYPIARAGGELGLCGHEPAPGRRGPCCQDAGRVPAICCTENLGRQRWRAGTNL